MPSFLCILLLINVKFVPSVGPCHCRVSHTFRCYFIVSLSAPKSLAYILLLYVWLAAIQLSDEWSGYNSPFRDLKWFSVSPANSCYSHNQFVILFGSASIHATLWMRWRCSRVTLDNIHFSGLHNDDHHLMMMAGWQIVVVINQSAYWTYTKSKVKSIAMQQKPLRWDEATPYPVWCKANGPTRRHIL